jgi:hypothetical protein
VPARHALALALAAALALLAVPASAAMYKWVDKNGRVVDSDQPPPPDVKSEIVKPPPPPANPNAAQELADKQLELRMKEKKQAEAAKADEAKRAENERRREICQQARGQLRGMLATGNRPLVRYNEKGEMIALDDAARLAAIENQQRTIRENCLTERSVAPRPPQPTRNYVLLKIGQRASTAWSRPPRARRGPAPPNALLFSRLAWLIWTSTLAFSVAR